MIIIYLWNPDVLEKFPDVLRLNNQLHSDRLIQETVSTTSPAVISRGWNDIRNIYLQTLL